jgi:hypothetical protein
MAIVPFCGILVLTPEYGSVWFAAMMSVYALIYRPVIHIVRLLKLKAIERKNAWKLFIPFYGSKYLRPLWFG